jgi:hypothetical protein
MKGARPKQLPFVFADSPTGSKGAGVSDESGPRAYLLHTAKGMSETDLAAKQPCWPLARFHSWPRDSILKSRM